MGNDSLTLCPCCGGAAVAVYTHEDPGYTPASTFIQCTRCGLRTGTFYDKNEFKRGRWVRIENGASGAIAAWNRRTE